jgi:hypothetical protein
MKIVDAIKAITSFCLRNLLWIYIGAAVLALSGSIGIAFLQKGNLYLITAIDERTAPTDRDVRETNDAQDAAIEALRTEVDALRSELMEVRIHQGRQDIVLDRLHADWSNLE